MRRRLFVLAISSVVLVSILFVPTLIAGNEGSAHIFRLFKRRCTFMRAKGEWKYALGELFQTATTEDGYEVIYADAVEEWCGTIKGPAHDIWYGAVDPEGNFHATGHSTVKGKVAGKKGTVVIHWVGMIPAGESEWQGEWVILSGTGKLKNLHGREHGGDLHLILTIVG
jgi:hypothetical protein